MSFRKVISLSIILLLAVMQLMAQRNQFVYLQTETMEPFFVVLNKKNISSSSVGHVILSGLQPGTYNIQVGFPGNNNLQEYTINVSEADQGFIVKKAEDANFLLVNMHTSAVQRSGEVKQAALEAERQKALAAEKRKQEEEEAKRLAAEQARQKEEAEALAAKEAKERQQKEIESQKAREEELAMAKKAEEAAVPEKTIQKQEVKKETVNQSGDTKKTETASSAQERETVNTNAAVEKTVVETEAISEVKGVAEVKPTSTVPGYSPPVEKVLTAAEIAMLQEEARRIDARGKRDSVLAAEKAKTTVKPANQTFLDIEMTMPDSVTKEEGYVIVPKEMEVPKKEELLEQPKVVPVVVAPVEVKEVAEIKKDTVTKSEPAPAKTNPNCEKEASDAELDLISQMVKREKDPDDGIDMLKKSMKVKCINTAQLRKLCLLFPADQHRYALLDMAYRYTTDQENYRQLSDLLTDIYYLNRFKAMLQ